MNSLTMVTAKKWCFFHTEMVCKNLIGKDKFTFAKKKKKYLFAG